MSIRAAASNSKCHAPTRSQSRVRTQMISRATRTATLSISLLLGCSESPAPAPAPSPADAGIDHGKVAFDPTKVIETLTPGATQREPSVEIDSQGNVWIAFIDFPKLGVNDPHVRYTRSTDGGRTFEPSKELCSNCADPALAIDSHDRVFLATIDRNAPRSARLTRIDALPDNPGAPVVVSNPSDSSPDREWIAVGPNDEVFLTWNAGAAENSALYFTKSIDHGKSIAPSVRIVTPLPGETVVYGAMAIGPGGSINVAFPSGLLDITGSDITTNHIGFTRSNDGGKTFSAPVSVPMSAEQPAPGPLGNGSFKALFINWPSIAVLPSGEALVTWPAQRANAPDAVDIVTSRTADGKTFSAPIPADSEGATMRTMPWSNVGDDGALHVFWLDTRNYPGGKNAPWDVYYARSVDGARTFEASQKLSAARFFGDPGERVSYAIGEFNAIRARKDAVYIVWSGAVADDVDIFIARGTVER